MKSLVDYARSLVGTEYSESGVRLGSIEWATVEDHCVVVQVEPRGAESEYMIPFEAVVDEICLRDDWTHGPILHPIHNLLPIEEGEAVPA